jgi:anti-anti-sigma factor
MTSLVISSRKRAVIRFPGSVLRAEEVEAIQLPKQPRRAVVLNLAEVSFLTAGGLGKLVALHKELLARGGSLILCNVDAEVYQVFELVRLTEVLDVRRSGDR